MSGRARGKHTQRPVAMPNTPEGNGIGASDRMQSDPSPIPGGAVHIENQQTVRQRVAVPDSPAEIKDLNAHGVTPGTFTARDRADTMRGPNTPDQPHIPQYEPLATGPVPVPVRIVQDGRSAPLRTAAPHKFTVPANTGEWVRLCGADKQRVKILLLNEDASNGIRFAQRNSDLTGGNGALLPSAMTSYLALETQDELYALSNTATAVTISVIQIFEQPL